MSEVGSYVSEKINVSKLRLENYISTENMISNRGGISMATKLPSVKTATAFQKGDILISNIRPYFKKIWLADKSGGCSNDVLVIRSDSNFSNRFLYYVLSSDTFFDYAVSTSKGTKMPRGDKSSIMKYTVPLFSLEEQELISDILKSYDEKIQLNKQINHHLEEMIDAIFLRYIESSKQLEVKKLGELFDTKTATFNPAKASEEKVNHFSLPAFDASQYPLVDETNNIKSNKNIIKEYSVLFSKLNPSTKRVWVPFTNQELISVCSTEFVSLAGKDKIEQAILFAIINSQIFQDYFVAHATGTTNSRQRTKPSVAYEFEIPYNKNLLYQLGRTLSPLLTQLEDNLHQIHKITQIRNELLPKLLSGELSVTQAAK